MKMEWSLAEGILCVMGAAAVLLMAAEYIRQKHKLPALLIGAGSGLAALLLLHTYGAAVGFTPPLTLLTVGVSAVLGIPGVILLLFV
jgi:hypothetical protein